MSGAGWKSRRTNWLAPSEAKQALRRYTLKNSFKTRFLHHLVLLLAAIMTGAAFYYFLAPRGQLFWLSMATAYASLALLALSLMIGPWNVLRGNPNPVSGYLRRDIGIWAGVLGIAHVVPGLLQHFRGRMWLYFLPPPNATYSFPLRIDAFGLTNYAGLGATLILLLLLSLSNNASLRSLGAGRWKSLQRWNYAAALLVVAHGAVYQVLEKRMLGFVLAFGTVALVTLAAQIAGFGSVKKKA
ncbi:MAG: hypothetical protein ABI648_17920 [Betaproteobacteria bacterium]